MARKVEITRDLEGVEVRASMMSRGQVLGLRLLAAGLGLVLAVLLVPVVALFVLAFFEPDLVEVAGPCQPEGAAFDTSDLTDGCLEHYPVAAQRMALRQAASRREGAWLKQLEPLYIGEIEPFHLDGAPSLVAPLPEHMQRTYEFLSPEEKAVFRAFWYAPEAVTPQIHHLGGRKEILPADHPMITEAARRTQEEVELYAPILAKFDDAIRADHAAALKEAGFEVPDDRFVDLGVAEGLLLMGAFVGFVLLAFVLSLLLIRPKVTVAVGTHAIRWTGRTLPWSEVRGIRKARGRMEVFDSAGRVLQSPRLHDEEVLDAVVDAALALLPRHWPPEGREGSEEETDREALHAVRDLRSRVGEGG